VGSSKNDAAAIFYVDKQIIQRIWKKGNKKVALGQEVDASSNKISCHVKLK
jgi:ribosomal protein L31E